MRESLPKWINILNVLRSLTLLETNIAPENGWLESWNTNFLLGPGLFSGARLLVSGSVLVLSFSCETQVDEDDPDTSFSLEFFGPKRVPFLVGRER